MATLGTLRLFKNDGSLGPKYALKDQERCTIGSQITCTIRLYINDLQLKAVHCLVEVHKNGVATLINKAPLRPVQVNGEDVLKCRCLRNGDVISVLSKRFLYENENLSSGTIKKTEKQVKNALLKEGRKSLHPAKPKKSLTVPATRKRVSRRSESSGAFVTMRSGSKRLKIPTLLPSKLLSTPTVQRGMRVHIPKSLNRPSTSMGRRLRKTKMQSSDEDNDPSRELKTPVTENLDENSFSTPQNNTSLVVIENPIEEETQVRSKRSKVKKLSIQRLINNDDSVIMLGTPVSKTPKTTLKTGARTKTPKSALKKSKIMTELLGSEICTSTPAKRKSVVIVEDTLGSDVSVMSDFTEESVYNTSITNLSAVEVSSTNRLSVPNVSRKSLDASMKNSASKSFHSTRPITRRSTIHVLSKSVPSTSTLPEVMKPNNRSTRSSKVSSFESNENPDSLIKPEICSSSDLRRGRKRNRGSDDSLLPAKKFRYKLSTTLDEGEFTSSIGSSLLQSPDASERRAKTEPRIKNKRMLRNSLPPTILFSKNDSFVECDLNDPNVESSLKSTKAKTPKKETLRSLRSQRASSFVVVDSAIESCLQERFSENETFVLNDTSVKTPNKGMLRSSTGRTASFTKDADFVLDDSKGTSSPNRPTPLTVPAMTEPRMQRKKILRSSLPATTLFAEVDDNNEPKVDSTPLMSSTHSIKKIKTPQSISKWTCDETDSEDSRDESTPSMTLIPLRDHALTEPRIQRKKILRSSLPPTTLFANDDSIESKVNSTPLMTAPLTMDKADSEDSRDESTPSMPSIPLGDHALPEPRIQRKNISRSSLQDTTFFAEVDDTSESKVDSTPLMSPKHSIKKPKMPQSSSKRTTPLAGDETDTEVSRDESTPSMSSIPLRDHAMTEPRIQRKRILRSSLPPTTLFTNDDSNESKVISTPLMSGPRRTSPLTVDKTDSEDSRYESTPSMSSIPLRDHAMPEPRIQRKNISRSSLQATTFFVEVDDTNESKVDSTPVHSIKTPKTPQSSSKWTTPLTDDEDSRDKSIPSKSSTPLVDHAMTEPRIQRKKIPRSSLPATTLFADVDDTNEPNVDSTPLTSPKHSIKKPKTPQSSSKWTTPCTDEKAHSKDLRDKSIPSKSSIPLVDHGMTEPRIQRKKILRSSLPATTFAEVDDTNKSKAGSSLPLRADVDDPNESKVDSSPLMSPEYAITKVKTTQSPNKWTTPITKDVADSEDSTDESFPSKSSVPLKEHAMTEPRIQKKKILRSSLPNQFAKDDDFVDYGDSTVESMDTSSFIYVPGRRLTRSSLTHDNNDSSSPRGEKQMVKTPKLQKEPLNDLSSPKGVKRLMKTPKVPKEPLNDLSSPKGVKRLMKTPKVPKGPLNDLSSPKGVKRLMKTPKVPKEPLNDLSSPKGVKRLMKTPKAPKEPLNDLSSPRGVKQLMASPRKNVEPENDLTKPFGLRTLFSPNIKKEPLNDLSSPKGVKRLMKTPKVPKEPLNDLSNPRGVKQLMASPRSSIEPKNDLTNPFSLRPLFSPKIRKEPKNDLTEVEGLYELFRTDSNIRTYSRKKLNPPSLVNKFEELLDLDVVPSQSGTAVESKKDSKVSSLKKKNFAEVRISEGTGDALNTPIQTDTTTLMEKSESTVSSSKKNNTPIRETRTRSAKKVLSDRTNKGNLIANKSEDVAIKITAHTRSSEEGTIHEFLEEVKENVFNPEGTDRDENVSGTRSGLKRGQNKTAKSTQRKDDDLKESEVTDGPVEEENIEIIETQKRVRPRKRIVKEVEITENSLQEEGNFENSDTPKLGRGRRKVAVKEPEVTEKTETPKRGRGRKKVVPIDQPEVTKKGTEEEQNFEKVEAPKSGTKRTVDAVEEVGVTNKSPEKTETPKRSRGRKKAEPVVVNVLSVKRKRKIIKSIDDIQQEALDFEVMSAPPEVTKKSPEGGQNFEKTEMLKRITKKKVDAVEEAEVIEKDLEGEVNVEPSKTQSLGRGRRKVVAVKEPEGTKKTETPKRGRGRKKVAPVEEPESLEAEQNFENTEMPKRARQKKKIDAVEEAEVTNKRLEEEETVVRNEIKLGRGGRRKVVAVEEPEVTKKTATPKRGKGRKKVVEFEESEVSKKSLEEEQNFEKIETPEEDAVTKKSPEEEEESVERSEMSKPGRTRRKVVAFEEVEVTETTKKETPKRGRGRKKAEPAVVDVLPVETKRSRKIIKSTDDVQVALDAEMMPAPPKKGKLAKKILVEAPPEQAIRRSARTRK